MATITSAAAGNWSNTATWTGGVVPGVGDVAKLQHHVTLDADEQVGGIDPTGVGVLLEAPGKNYRVLVGGTNVSFVAQGIRT